MKYAALFILLVSSCLAQDKPKALPTALNFGVRAFDTAQTCYHLQDNKYWHERLLPTQSCGGVAAINAGFAFGAYFGDALIIKRHPKLAMLQYVSIAGGVHGIVYTYTFRK